MKIRIRRWLDKKGWLLTKEAKAFMDTVGDGIIVHAIGRPENGTYYAVKCPHCGWCRLLPTNPIAAVLMGGVCASWSAASEVLEPHYESVATVKQIEAEFAKRGAK